MPQGPEQPSGSSMGKEAAQLLARVGKRAGTKPSQVLLPSRSKTEEDSGMAPGAAEHPLKQFLSGLNSHTAQAPPGAPAQTPSAVSDPELVIFLKRLAAHTPMKFFCKRGRREMLILP